MIGKTNVGGSKTDVFAFIRVTYPVGAVCTCSKSGVTLEAPDTSGSAVFRVPSYGTWTITATLSAQTATTTVTIASTGRGTSETAALSFRVPVAYQEVEYLESTASGGQYINLNSGYYSGYTYTIKFKLSSLGANNAVCGAWDGASLQGLVALPLNAEDGVSYIAGTGSVAGGSTAVTTAVISGSSVTINGTAHSWTPGYTGSLNMYLFGINYVNGTLMYGGALRIYAFKVTYNGNDLVDLVPCYRKSDSVKGFWDVVNERFITNSGSGTFNAGPNV